MEIHPPSHPIMSLREFFVHLSMVTIGILIALGLEQTVEAWHHRELGVEARENILNEIRDNKQKVDRARPVVARNKEALQRSLATLRLYMAHKPPQHGEMQFLVSGPTLSTTSWTTASTTGALGYMSYAEAKRFAGAYQVQAVLQHAEDDMVQSAVPAFSLVAFNSAGPAGLRDDQLRDLERQISNCLGNVVFFDQVADQLSKEYARVLAK